MNIRQVCEFGRKERLSKFEEKSGEYYFDSQSESRSSLATHRYIGLYAPNRNERQKNRRKIIISSLAIS